MKLKASSTLFFISIRVPTSINYYSYTARDSQKSEVVDLHNENTLKKAFRNIKYPTSIDYF